MIVQMKKISLIVADHDREKFLGKLKEIRALHIKEVSNETFESDQELYASLEAVNTALSIINCDSENKDPGNGSNAKDYIQKILTFDQTIKRLDKELEERERQNSWYKTWGALSVETLQLLKKSGVFIRLYTATKNVFAKLPTDKQVYIIKKNKSEILFAYFSDGETDRLELNETTVPDAEYDFLQKRITEIEREIKETKSLLAEMSQFEIQLLHYRANLEDEVKLDKAKESMKNFGKISCLQGFCPKDDLPRVLKLADTEGLAFIVQNPDDINETPTLIRSPKWLQIINPVFQFMGAKPGYNEYDISLWFLIFFSLFFAMLVGDGGYGLLFVMAAFLISKKKKDMAPEPIRLIYLLGGATVLWGAISGTWFGYEGFARLPGLNLLVVDQINSFVDGNQSFMMYLSFMIGVVHLSIARLMAVVKYINSLKAVAELGWIAVLWSVFFLAGNLVLGKSIPAVISPVFTIGLLCVLLFSNPKPHFLKGILLTLTELPLKVIGSFSDVVSYLRLFAVGYATVVVASSFNGMALDFGFDSLFTGLASAALLFIGHTTNIMLALMAVIVHGVRLNMLEFSGHLNMQWSGKKFDPFK